MLRVGIPVVCAGEILVDLIPREVGPYREGSLIEIHFGGAPANVAVGVSRLGVESAFLGAVGNDPLGDMLIEYLKMERVFEKWVARKNARTSLAFVMAKPGGERDFFFYRLPWALTADALLSVEDVDWSAIKKSQVIHISGVALSQPPLRNTMLEVMKVAAEEGIHVSLDPNYRPDIWLNAEWAAREAVNKALSYADVVMFGYDEMLPLFGTEDHVQVARSLLSRNSRLKYVAVRLGSKGAFVAGRDREVFSKAFKVQAVDTTGAGDAWAAGFIVFKLVEERSLEEAVMLANAVAGIKCTKRGATFGMPRRDELKAFLQKEGIEVDI